MSTVGFRFLRGKIQSIAAMAASSGFEGDVCVPEKYERPYHEVREILLKRAKHDRNPLDNIEYEPARQVLEQLTSTDREAWAKAFSAAAEPYEEKAWQAERRGDDRAAAENWRLAYGCYRIARYPAPNSPAKQKAYRQSQACFLKEASYADPPLQRVSIPFAGRPGEGREIIAYLRKPRSATGTLQPLVIVWGGIDSFKEERRVERYLKAGLAALTIDMPGVADAPLAGSEDAERMWDAIFDWVADGDGRREGLDAARIGLVGCSTGGYWATKLAHTHKDRICAAINHGGPAHYAFTAEWIHEATKGEYPFELAETLACAFGRTSFEEWVDYAPRLSLLTQGLLDRPCAPLLCVNGINDSVFPIADHYLLLQHGDAKAARFFPGGHMGHGPGWDVTDTLVAWLADRLLPDGNDA
jgi:pimeloyl-ACP methyl ester carboxylesterase